ncbi:uncharacterized protein bub1ba isoform X2 [Betta splendens]|uniref:Uncharacterized protein bub1ba isoform X2 n=1 Tax=Betta splendens TaxID=158456 RepID=A0A8M1HB17_BETSP|nr:uncharacterized protein bub1ba isoform X2 [Betta splendens]
MAEGLVMQVDPVFSIRGTHLSGQLGSQNQDGANVRSEYCPELLMRRGGELSFEELRAERYFQIKDREIDEKMKHVKKTRKQLSQVLEEKDRLYLFLRSQMQVPCEASSSHTSDCGRPPAAASFQIHVEDPSQPAPGPGALVPSGVSQSCAQTSPVIQFGLCSASEANHHEWMTEDQTPAHSHPPSIPERPGSKIPVLSPIEETSLSAGNHSSLEDYQDLEVRGASPGCALTAGASVDPCDPDVRSQLLELCDVASSPDLHSEGGHLPALEESSCVQLGGNIYVSLSKVVDRGNFCVYKGVKDTDNVLIKVDSCSVPWDFHQFSRLKKSLPKANDLPQVSCFVFLDGCITVYTGLLDHVFTERSECEPSDLTVVPRAIGLLQMVSQLHSSRLLHAALQPHTLACFYSGVGRLVVFPVDWSFSVDLDLQHNVTSAQQLPSALSYIRLGLLDPTASPQLVDLVGVAETVHLLLTNSKMLPVKDDQGWTAEQFSGREHCDRYSRMWQTFFRALLNVDGPSSQSVVSVLIEQMLALYH